MPQNNIFVNCTQFLDIDVVIDLIIHSNTADKRYALNNIVDINTPDRMLFT